MATEGPVAAELLAGKTKGEPVVAPTDRSSTCLYFAIDGQPPVTDPLLVLNGEGTSKVRSSM